MKQNKLIGNALLVFKVCYLTYLLLAFNAFVNGTAVMNYAAYVITAWGLVLTGWMAVSFKKYKTAPCVLVLGAFVASYIISAVLNRKYGITGNLKAVIWMIFPILLVYISSAVMDKTELKREMKILAVIYLVYTSLVNAVGLSMVYWGRNLDITDQYGKIHSVGFRWGRLWGIYDDPNHGATITIVAVIIAASLFVNVKRIWVRIILVVSLLINYLYIVFSDSRTGAICVGISAAAGIFFVVILKMKTKRRSIAIISAAVAAIIVGCACIAVSSGVKTAYNRLDVKIVKMIQLKKAEEAKKNGGVVRKKSSSTKKATIGRAKDLAKDASNGRLQIWESGLEIAKNNPVFGVSYRNMTEYTKKNLPDSFLVKNPSGFQYDSMHNLEMDILVSQGIIGIILFLILFVQMASVLVKGISKVTAENRMIAAEVFTIVCALGVASTFISIIFYVNTPQGFCFWAALGYLMALIKAEDTTEKEEIKELS